MNYVVSELDHAITQNMRLLAKGYDVEKDECAELSFRLSGHSFPSTIDNLFRDLPVFGQNAKGKFKKPLYASGERRNSLTSIPIDDGVHRDFKKHFMTQSLRCN